MPESARLSAHELVIFIAPEINLTHTSVIGLYMVQKGEGCEL